MLRFFLPTILLFATFAPPAQREPKPFMRGELIFAPERKHNHGSCIVECPNGDLLVCWYNGFGERTADDVRILGARLRRKTDDGRRKTDDGKGLGESKIENGKLKIENRWSAPFLMADTPGFPDCNPCMMVDSQRRLWLLWPVILDNHWESALMKYRISADYLRDAGPPKWAGEHVLHLKPGPEFAAAVERDLDAQWASARSAASPEARERLDAYLRKLHGYAKQPLQTRLGWMTRVHPFTLDDGRILVPLYSDAFDFSLIAITDDLGETWSVSAPMIGAGNVQPTLAHRKDGTLVAFFRDNGPPPQRVMVSESRDRGQTWTPARDIDLPNPGSGLDVVKLRSGRWLLIYNDTERGRHSLAVSLSNDEGRTWPITRHLERDEPGAASGSYSYPSIIQAKDGTIHATYSYKPNAANATREGQGESIKHVAFNEDWALMGDG